MVSKLFCVNGGLQKGSHLLIGRRGSERPRIQGCSKPNTAWRSEKISGGAKYFSSFLKFEVKKGHKSAKKAKS